jgi:hypothetical protein
MYQPGPNIKPAKPEATTTPTAPRFFGRFNRVQELFDNRDSLTHDEYALLAAIETRDYLRNIRGILIFFLVVSIISIVLAVISVASHV